MEARKERKKGPVSAAQHLAHGLPPPGPVLHAVLCTSPPRTERALQDLLLSPAYEKSLGHLGFQIRLSSSHTDTDVHANLTYP